MSSVILRKLDEIQHTNNLMTILFIGSIATGKTSLIARLNHGKFVNITKATLGIDMLMIGATVNGKDYRVQLIDTCGVERFDSVMSTVYRAAKGTMIVYDVTKYSSYESIKYWMLQVHNFTDKGYPIILLGNKSDIDMHAVNHIDGQKVAEDLEMDGFFKTSAKTGEGIDDAMKLMIELIVSRNDCLLASQNEKLSQREPDKCVC